MKFKLKSATALNLMFQSLKLMKLSNPLKIGSLVTFQLWSKIGLQNTTFYLAGTSSLPPVKTQLNKWIHPGS